MKPLLSAVVAVCFIIATSAAPENIEEVKELPQKSAIEPDAEESEPQARAERCTTCGGGLNLGFQSPNLARLQAIPGAEVHSQSSFEGCSSDKGCAGIKVKDGRVIEKFGNVDSFRQAASANGGNEFTFHAAGTFGNDVFQGGIPKEGPFWWMNENSPFKAAGGGVAGAGGAGGSYEKFSKSQSSSFTSGGGAGGSGLNGAGLAINAQLDLSGNPYLNGELSKQSSGFASQSGSSQFASGSGSQFGSAGNAGQFGSAGNAGQFGATGGAGQFGAASGGGASQFGSGSSGASQFSSGSSGSSQFSSGSSGQFGSGSRNTGQFGAAGGANQFGAAAGANQFGAAGGANQFGAAGGANQFGAAGGASQFGQESSSSFSKPAGGSYQSSYESSSFSSSSKGGEVDISKNPYLNGGFKNQAGQAAFGAQASFGASAPATSNFAASSGNKFASSGYTGSSPSPFTASTAGANVNLIQNTQKASEFDFEAQQNQQNIDEIFQETGNVHAHEHSGGELQQTCAGQGYVCVHKAQCNNGVVNTNGAGILQAKTKKQYCNIKNEICCRIEISTLQGAGGLQGSLGVGSATYSGSGSQNTAGSSIFSTAAQAGSANNAFGQESGSNQRGNAFGSQGGNTFTQTSGFESSSSSFGSSGTAGNRGNNFGAAGAGQSGQSGFNAQGSSSSTFGSNSQGSQFGTNQGSGFQGGAGGFGANGAGVNRGVTIESSQSSFESSSRGTNLGANGNKFGAGSTGSGFNANGFASTGAPFGAGSTNKFGATGSSFGAQGNEVIKTTNTQTNFIETDSFSAGSDVNGIYRPGASGLKPGVPYLPPVDNSNAGSSQVSQTSFSSTFAPTRPVYTTPKPTYLPPSTSAPGYLPPVDGEQTINTETRVPGPVYNDGSLILDESRFPNRPKKPVPQNNDIPSGCAAALKCTPIEYCTAEGVISNTTVALTRDQEAYRVPLTDCKDVTTNVIGKCCRDPYYTDPWPVNLIGKWAPGVFGGDDGKYTPDSRGSSNNPRPIAVTVRPPVTGSVILSPNRQPTPKPTLPPYGPNQVTPGFPSSTASAFAQKGQFELGAQGQYEQRGQGQYEQRGQGQYEQRGQGQYEQRGQGQLAQGAQGSQFAAASQSQFNQNAFAQNQAQKGQAFGQRGQGQTVTQGQGLSITQGQGQIGQAGIGQYGLQGQGQIEIQEQNSQSKFSQTQGSSSTRGQGQLISQGQGQLISQGAGTGIRQGQGFSVSQGSGFGVENEYSESTQRVFLSRYSGGGQCGVFNGQKPYGNRNDLEVDFAEIPWQAMVLLQTNKSLLCGGVITRPDVVVTSAACVDGLQAKNVLIKGGEWKLGIDDEPLPFQIVQVKTILRHPFYKQGNLLFDAAILVLTENLRLAKNIYPICLPGAQETLDAYYNGAGECIVTGWGKQVLQAHLAGSIMHSLNVSLINPGECQAKLSQEYPHLLEQYDQDSCACGQPTNPINNICRVDTGSALACTTGDGHWVLRGVYSWDSGCQPGNQLAAFYKFDLEWYEWAIGQIESARFAAFGGSSQVSQSSQSSRFSGQINSGVKGGQFAGVKGGVKGGFGSGIKGQFGGQFGNSQSQFSQFSKYTSESSEGSNFQGSIKPIQNSFSASYSEKKVFQSEPKIITYTTKPEIVTFTTKPEIFTYTTKPKIVTYTTKPQIITYETSGSGLKPQYAAPAVTFNPSFSELVGSQHTHNAACKCNGKK